MVEKVNVETVNEETKESNSEEEDIGIRKCRRKNRIYKIKEEVKGWTSSSKQQEYPPEITKTKEETRLERTKRKLKRSALEWDDFMLQDQLKSFMYVERSLCGHPKKDKSIDELNFTNCMHLSRIQKRMFLLVLQPNKESLSFILNLWLSTI